MTAIATKSRARLPVAAGGGTKVSAPAVWLATATSAAPVPAQGLGAGVTLRSGRMLANMPRARLRPVIAPAASTAGTPGPAVVLPAEAGNIGAASDLGPEAPEAAVPAAAVPVAESVTTGGAADGAVDAAAEPVLTAAAATSVRPAEEGGVSGALTTGGEALSAVGSPAPARERATGAAPAGGEVDAAYTAAAFAAGGTLEAMSGGELTADADGAEEVGGEPTGREAGGPSPAFCVVSGESSPSPHEKTNSRPGISVTPACSRRPSAAS